MKLSIVSELRTMASLWRELSLCAHAQVHHIDAGKRFGLLYHTCHISYTNLAQSASRVKHDKAYQGFPRLWDHGSVSTKVRAMDYLG
jgi:hypothetical protein